MEPWPRNHDCPRFLDSFNTKYADEGHPWKGGYTPDGYAKKFTRYIKFLKRRRVAVSVVLS